MCIQNPSDQYSKMIGRLLPILFLANAQVLPQLRLLSSYSQLKTSRLIVVDGHGPNRRIQIKCHTEQNALLYCIPMRPTLQLRDIDECQHALCWRLLGGAQTGRSQDTGSHVTNLSQLLRPAACETSYRHHLLSRCAASQHQISQGKTKLNSNS